MPDSFEPNSRWQEDPDTKSAIEMTTFEDYSVREAEMKVAQDNTQANIAALETARINFRAQQLKFFKAAAKDVLKRADVPETEIDVSFFDKIDFTKDLTPEAQGFTGAQKASMQKFLDQFQKQLGAPFEKAMKWDQFTKDFSDKIKQLPKDGNGNPTLTPEFLDDVDKWVNDKFQTSWTDSQTDVENTAWLKKQFKRFLFLAVLGVSIFGIVTLVKIIEGVLCRLAQKTSGCYVTFASDQESSRQLVIYNTAVPKDCSSDTCCKPDALCVSTSLQDICGGDHCCNASIDALAAKHPNGTYAYHCGSASDWLYDIVSSAGADVGDIWGTAKKVIIYGIIAVGVLFILYILLKLGKSLKSSASSSSPAKK